MRRGNQSARDNPEAFFCLRLNLLVDGELVLEIRGKP
jgi:hypothetical protein